jgi:hypothetical protein
MNINANETWFGVVEKTGAMLGPIGLETIVGAICRVDGLPTLGSSYWGCGATPGVRLGLGLGASVGLSIVIVLGTQFYIDLHGLDIGGPSINIAVEEKMAAKPIFGNVSKAEFAALKAFAGLGQGVGATIKESVIMNIVNNIMNGIAMASGNKPIGFAIDIPYAGYGLEISACWTVEYRLELQALRT